LLDYNMEVSLCFMEVRTSILSYLTS